jgi:hypothetical protein
MSEEDKRKWQVELTISGGKKFYRVFRFRDPNGEDTSENRESRGLYERYQDADRLREILNEKEDSK